MYNNYSLILGDKLDDFKKIYEQIILIIKKIKLSDDKLLNQIYKYYKKQKNFKYQIH